ncbi:predicted protein [Naegleria gruberi]|uniref:Mitochondrial import inner membrane translocase subunit TIM50 n=1 Tax=Naegleria gruberi TaxID=5762 RepID=D2VB69_NAEGR|nr:uncharacterized protein NAEGRDRAFT_66111 [Naegleria gruberi]EFC45855.1 predicted protein [Naegleria gruberi]|eukprot:XP_002678599.1 predicted protein [Naegleria gruberi strain NEG-M]
MATTTAFTGKRKLDDAFDYESTSSQIDDPTLIDDLSADELSPATPDESSLWDLEDKTQTPPKKTKLNPLKFSVSPPLISKQTSNTTTQKKRTRKFNCNFKATKGLFANVTFTLKNNGDKSHKMEEQIVNIISNPHLKSDVKLNNNDIYLEIKDFISDESLSLYKDLKTNLFHDYIPQFEISGKDEQSRYILCYLKGMLVRKSEIAIVPIPNHTHQILVFDHINDKSYSDTPCSLEGYLLDDFEFDSKLTCIIVPKFVMALDLDETLIRTRVMNPNEVISNPSEYEFSVLGSKYVCYVRPGTQQLLSWCCTVFQVYIFTNSIFEYAREVCKILDPNKEHLIKYIDVDDTIALKKMLKSREDMTPHESIPKPLGLKDLKKFDIDCFETVIFDDDITIWKQQECVLPFADIVQYRKPLEFFKSIRTEVWKKLQFLHSTKLRIRKKHELAGANLSNISFAIPERKDITLSQEIALNSTLNKER